MSESPGRQFPDILNLSVILTPTGSHALYVSLFYVAREIVAHSPHIFSDHSLDCFWDIIRTWDSTPEGSGSTSEDCASTSEGSASETDPCSDAAEELHAHYAWLSSMHGIEHAGQLLKEELLWLPDIHSDPSAVLEQLAYALDDSFLCQGAIADLDLAILCMQQRYDMYPTEVENLPSILAKLGRYHLSRCNKTTDLVSIKLAVQYLHQAVDLTPDGHSDKTTWLNNLGTAFEAQFEQLGDMADLESAISFKQQAVYLTPDGHSDKAAWLSNLGAAFQARYERLRDMADLESAITLKQQAVDLTPDGHPGKATILCTLGDTLYTSFKLSTGKTALQTVISTFHNAATCSVGHPIVKCEAGHSWAKSCQQMQSVEGDCSSLTAYSHILNVCISEVVWLGKLIKERHKAIVLIDNIPLEAAAVAIKCAEYITAIEWLEQGRAIVWGQMLHLRTPINELTLYHPKLASRLMEISQALEHDGTISDNVEFGLHSKSSSLETQAQTYRKLARERDTLVIEIRTLPRFEQFLKPKQFAELSQAATSGPVVIINVHQTRCDALIISAGLNPTRHISLSSFSLIKAEKLQKKLQDIVADGGRNVRDSKLAVDYSLDERFWKHGVLAATVSQNSPSKNLKEVLAVLWKDVVKPVIDVLELLVSN